MTVTADPVLATPDDECEAGGAPVDLAVVFTDLEGFTAFTAAEGDDAAGRLLLAHYRHAEQLAGRRGGRVVKRLGDGLLLVFASPPAAVLTCLELAETAPLPLRAGVHRGGVNVTADDDDLAQAAPRPGTTQDSNPGDHDDHRRHRPHRLGRSARRSRWTFTSRRVHIDRRSWLTC